MQRLIHERVVEPGDDRHSGRPPRAAPDDTTASEQIILEWRAVTGKLGKKPNYFAASR